MNRKEHRIFSFLIFAIMLLLILLFASCGPAYHLQRAEHHISKAIEKGADFKKDTVIFHFKSPEIKFSTTIRPAWIGGAPVPLWRDSLRYTDPKTGTKITAKVNLPTNCPDSCYRDGSLYLKANVPPQEQTAEVPCQTVKAGYTGWELIGTCFAVAVVFTVIGMFIQGRR